MCDECDKHILINKHNQLDSIECVTNICNMCGKHIANMLGQYVCDMYMHAWYILLFILVSVVFVNIKLFVMQLSGYQICYHFFRRMDQCMRSLKENLFILHPQLSMALLRIRARCQLSLAGQLLTAIEPNTTYTLEEFKMCHIVKLRLVRHHQLFCVLVYSAKYA